MGIVKDLARSPRPKGAAGATLEGLYLSPLPQGRSSIPGALRAYIEGTGPTDAAKGSRLFRTGERRGSSLTDRPMSPHAVRRMLKRRIKAAGLPEILSPHSFRVLVVTDLLSQNVLLEDVQYLAGHAHPRTTQIYDRHRRRVSRNLVERISV